MWFFFKQDNQPNDDEKENTQIEEKSQDEIRQIRLAKLQMAENKLKEEKVEEEAKKTQSIEKVTKVQPPVAKDEPMEIKQSAKLNENIIKNQTDEKKIKIIPLETALISKILEVTINRNDIATTKDNKLPTIINLSKEVNHIPVDFKLEHFSELVCARLNVDPVKIEETSGRASFDAMLYLYSCYERCSNELQRGKEATQQILIDMQTQLINFAATCLIEPSIFKVYSTSSHNTFLNMLKDEQVINDRKKQSFIQAIFTELDYQEYIPNIVTPILQLLFMKFQRIQSIHDINDDCTAHLNIFHILSQHKKVAGFIVQTQMTYLFENALQFENFSLIGFIIRLAGIPLHHSVNMEMFGSINTRILTLRDVEKKNLFLRTPVLLARNLVKNILTNLLKSSNESRRIAVRWLAKVIAVNRTAEMDQPDPMKTGSENFLSNFAAIMLKLCSPFVVSNYEKLKLIDLNFIFDENSHCGAFPHDTTPLVPFPSEKKMIQSESTSQFNFITQAFFVTFRAIHLGIVQQFQKLTRMHMMLHRIQQRAESGDTFAETQFQMMLKEKFAREALLLYPDMLTDLLFFVSAASEWLSNEIDSDNNIDDWSFDTNGTIEWNSWKRASIPEHFVNDILETLIFVTRFSPKENFTQVPLETVFTLTVKLLCRPKLLKSPHLRAKLGDILYIAFLPPEARDDPTTSLQISQLHHSLFQTHRLASHLPPGLLLLYGDVEHTGFYEKLEHRFYIAFVLKYLWGLEVHRGAFQYISMHEEYFIRFANGIMNETNSLFAVVMEKLPEIRQFQLIQKDIDAWTRLPEQEQQVLIERFEENERSVKNSLMLCNETISMLLYLTSDDKIRAPFLLPQLLPRLVSMLLSVQSQVVGKKGVNIKVDNPQNYNFEPKKMLQNIVLIILHFEDSQNFLLETIHNGFYSQQLFPKTLATIEKQNLLLPSQLQQFIHLCERLQEMQQLNEQSIDIDQVPEEFLDPILCTIMKDPVILPTSGHIMDRSAILQHLLNDEADPYNRKRLTPDMLQPHHQLKQRIDEWLQSQKK